MNPAKHYTIPVFLPFKACPFRCIFCDQEKISGHSEVPPPSEVASIVRSYLSTMRTSGRIVEVGFFGGTFTGFPVEEQRRYLEAILPSIKNGMVDSVRISTRPDFISEEILSLLKDYPVKTIELGAQSMDDSVLAASGRGHTSRQTEKASEMILRAGFSLGLQMMIGLPGDTLIKSMYTARKIVSAGASETRIYPVLVIRGTMLEILFNKGAYIPLSIDEAIERTKNVVRVFERSDVRILRIGLHPSEGLLSGHDLVAGPFHPSFRELVMTGIWADRFGALLKNPSGEGINLRIHPSQRNAAIGYSGQNRKILEKHYRKVKFIDDAAIKENQFHADYY
jgi:histone acetyltransferase (RNA polymerase elongator complex component)